ncbi:hypothetical protein [Virgibacillus sp. CBA3643]|uniref:hypothetical protein n=1 Tax=Virgibacillus sp. CBA3643 TaxID=2942278 RepID=UPI0035A3C78A
MRNNKFTLLVIGVLVLFVSASIFTVSVMASSPVKSNKQPEKSDSYNGVTFTIDNYEKEGNNLKINYTVTSESKLEEGTAKQPFLDRPSFYVEQKFLNTNFSEKITKVNNYKYTGYISLNLGDVEKDYSKLRIKINRISNQVGDWNLSLDY